MFDSALHLCLSYLAVLTHYTASLRVLHEEEVIANFWQQVVWRAPGIKAGTTLVVNYPSVNYAEDVDAVAGPANFIYFPEQTNQIPAVYQLAALPQMAYTTKDVLGGGNKSYGYRTHVGEINYNNMLVISQTGRKRMRPRDLFAMAQIFRTGFGSNSFTWTIFKKPKHTDRC